MRNAIFLNALCFILNHHISIFQGASILHLFIIRVFQVIQATHETLRPILDLLGNT